MSFRRLPVVRRAPPIANMVKLGETVQAAKDAPCKAHGRLG